MLLALFLVPLASLLWGITNHIDKHLISKISKNGDYKGLLLFSSLIAGMLLFPISLIICKFKIGVDIKFIVMIFLASISYLFGTLFYFKALKKNDASLVTSMFQLIPVFGYFLGLIFLKEVLTLKQIIGGLIVVSSSIAITYEIDNKKFDKTKLYALLFMSLSSLSYAVYFLLFRLTTISNNFYTMSFWYQIGLILCGILIIVFSKPYRNSFISLVKENGKKVFGFNLINEGLNIVANMLVNFSVTLAPMAIVLVLNGLQPLFVFLIGVIGVIFLPKIFSEDIKKNTIIQKVICIVISIIGLAVLYL